VLDDYDTLRQIIKTLTDLLDLLVPLMGAITSLVVATKKLISLLHKKKCVRRRKTNRHPKLR
jgi:hypothetical protein